MNNWAAFQHGPNSCSSTHQLALLRWRQITTSTVRRLSGQRPTGPHPAPLSATPIRTFTIYSARSRTTPQSVAGRALIAFMVCLLVWFQGRLVRKQTE